MKKIITVTLICLLLCSCKVTKHKSEDNPDDKYLNMLDAVSNRDILLFGTQSNYFDLTFEVTKTLDGYRYYIIVDNPRYAMYGVSLIGVEDGLESYDTIAANAGIFEETTYNLVPGQTNINAGYAGGITISGLSKSENAPMIRLLVQWHSKNQEVHQEFIYHDFNEEDA